MSDIESVLARLRDCEDHVAAAEEAVVLARVEAMETVMAVARVADVDGLTALYWNEAIRPGWIAEGKGVAANQLASLGLIRSKPSGVPCRDCGTDLPASSRTELKRLRDRPEWAQCQQCSDRHRAQITRDFEARAQRESQLRQMPYAEYLQTPEWEATRSQRLRSSGYRCDVCNGGNRVLDVHHRTYERRGREQRRDLTVLCRDCHSTFHETRALA